MSTLTKFPLILQLLSASVAACKKASEIIKGVLNHGDLQIVEKGVNDLQTEADRASQRWVISFFEVLFPTVKVIGEEDLGSGICENEESKEGISDVFQNYCDLCLSDSDSLEVLNISKFPDSYCDLKPSDVTIWLDPLDGTSEYTEGLLDHVTVLIGISVLGRAVGGVLAQPYHNYDLNNATKGRVVWGLKGVGVKGSLQVGALPEHHRIIATTRSHASATNCEAINAICPHQVIRVGGCGYKVLLVIEKKVHAYLYASSGSKKWDTCAPEAILGAIGGKMTDIFGRDYSYTSDAQLLNSRGIIATCFGSDHQWYVDQIPKSVKEKIEKDG